MGHRAADEPALGYSIRIVSSQTGIPAETLRVWERRYGFPKPKRRPGGGRLYSEGDVARLRLIARARDAGYRPGDVIALPDREIRSLLEQLAPRALPAIHAPSPPPALAAAPIDMLVTTLRTNEIARLRSALRSLAITLGPKAFVTDIAHPFAVAIGDAWEQGTIEVHHEHLATALLVTQLRLLRSSFEESEGPPTIVLATLPGEAHDLGLEMVAVYLAVHRATPHMLGADTPPEQIARAAEVLNADVVGLSVTLGRPRGAVAARAHLTTLRRHLMANAPELWIGGAGAFRVAAPGPSERIVTSWSDVDAALAATSSRQL